MLKLAVVGKDVSQSLSPKMHTFILSQMGVECRYDKRSVSPEYFSEEIEGILGEYDGLNVTIPFKGEVVSHLNNLQGDALSFGVVNTVRAGERVGDNTDGYGFLLMLQNAGIEVKGKSVLVLGAGGAGRSCIKKLTEAGAEVFAFERDRERLDGVLAEFGGFTPLYRVPVRPFDYILNCTGIGMHKTVGQTPSVTWESGESLPVGTELLSKCEGAIDLIYVPEQSEFLRVAHSLGKLTLNGEAMLFYQAYMSDCIFLGRQGSADEAKSLYEKYQLYLREEQA